MSEYCLECFNKEFDDNKTEKELKMSRDFTLCEGCRKLKRIVIKIKKVKK